MTRHPTTTAAALLALALQCLGAESPIRLTETQLAAGRVAFEKVRGVDPDAKTPGAASLQLSGRIVVPNTALDVVLAPATGRVESVLVNPGQKVAAGQPLAIIHSADIVALQTELLRSRSRVGNARARAERDRELHEAGIIARSRWEDSQAQLAQAEADLAEHTQLLRLAGFSDADLGRIASAADISPRLTVRARRAGSVLEQSAGTGDAVAPGAPMFRLARLAGLWAELRATRSQVALIATGDRVEIAGCPSPGKVIATATQLDSQNQTATVRVEMPSGAECLVPNQYVEARVSPKARRSALLSVPSGAVVQREGGSYVFVRTPAGLQPTVVQVERRTAESAWITGALKAGDEVASTGLAAIKGSWMGLGTTAEAAGAQP